MAAVFELGISAAEKLVLLAMADHARDDGTGCYPSIDTLARKTSQTRRGVQKIMRRLEHERCLIAPTANVKGGRNLATEYQITLEKGEQGSLFSRSKGRTPEHERANDSAERANQSAQKGEPGSPQPSGNVREPSRTVTSESEAFLLFIEKYPRHRLGVKSDVLREWQKIPSIEDHALEIVEGLERWNASAEWRDQEGRFVPKASNFLAAKLWSVSPRGAHGGIEGNSKSLAAVPPAEGKRYSQARTVRIG